MSEYDYDAIVKGYLDTPIEEVTKERFFEKQYSLTCLYGEAL